MDATRCDLIMQRWNTVQYDLIPQLRDETGMLTPKLEKLIYVLEWVRIGEFTAVSWCGVGRPPHERAWLANAFVAKSVLQVATTVGLIERLTIDRALRRICGFPMCGKLPSEATFSRAFDEFSKTCLPSLAHEALIKEHLGDELIGHISRDGTAIEARERPARVGAATTSTPAAQAALALGDEDDKMAAPAPVAAHAKKRGRPRFGEVRPGQGVADQAPAHACWYKFGGTRLCCSSYDGCCRGHFDEWGIGDGSISWVDG